jgi:Flp pilus assembly pilin Flp
MGMFRRGCRAKSGGKALGRLLADERGASFLEYIIIVGCIAIAASTSFRMFGRTLLGIVHQQGIQVANLEGDESNCVGGLCVNGGGPDVGGSGGSSTGGANDVAVASGEPGAVPPTPAGGGGGGAGGTGTGGGAGGSSAPSAAVVKLAEALTSTAGTATAADRAAVLKELEKMPQGALQALQNAGIKVTVVKNSVTEALPALKGVQPRGWPPGATWDNVPGLYDPTTKQVIIATRNGAVPATGDGHGSASLAIHETAHGVDAALNANNDPAFQAARNADLAKLPPYETQPGAAGREETYAESMAEYYSNPTAMQAQYPNLYAYWNSNPIK